MDGREHSVRQDGSLLHIQQPASLSQWRLRNPRPRSLRLLRRVDRSHFEVEVPRLISPSDKCCDRRFMYANRRINTLTMY